MWGDVRRGEQQLHNGAPRTGRNRATYVELDALVPNGWATLAGMHSPPAGAPFNMILSDGLHSSTALVAEMSHLLNHRLFTPAASVIAWDDCSRNLQMAVEEPLLKMMRAQHSTLCYTRVEIGGWIGHGEPPHGCCIMSTFPAAWTRSLFDDASAAPSSASSPAAVAARATFAQARKAMQCWES